jgi:ubiquitin carboxyl-terminal hydrolase 7
MEFAYHKDDPSECVMKWRVKNYINIKEERVLSNIGPDACLLNFQKLDWNLLLFPNGYNKARNIDISLFVAVSPQTPRDINCDVIFRVMVINQLDQNKNKIQLGASMFGYGIKNDGMYGFIQDLGFEFFTHRKPGELRDKNAGFLIAPEFTDIEIHLVLKIRKPLLAQLIQKQSSMEVLSSQLASMKLGELTADKPIYVGLENLGATCYLNSLLQALFHLRFFRNLVYLMPTEDEKEQKGKPISIPLALQRIFYNMQVSEDPVSTKDLTNSFGDDFDVGAQHDVQELLMLLMDRLEWKMKGSRVDGLLNEMFQGSFVSICKCLNPDIPFQSTRKESFGDLSLNVRGSTDLFNSFESYVAEEILDGDNKYQTDTVHGLQAARKYMKFERFPPVLFVHLKRFEFVPEGRNYVYRKVDEKLVFSPIIHLDAFLQDPPTDPLENTFQLHGVLVHRGTLNHGHYLAFLRPSSDPQWFEFDDHKVRKVYEQDAIENNYGGEEFGRTSSAYMLIYIKVNQVEKMTKDVTLDDLPPHLLERFARERVEKEEVRKAEYERKNFCVVGYCTEKEISEHTGNDLVDKNSGFKFIKRIPKEESREYLVHLIAKELGLSVERLRLWEWLHRGNNDTTRPAPSPLREREYQISLGSCQKNDDHVQKYYVEISEEKGGKNVPLFPSTENCSLLFFKYYNPEEQKLTYLGSKLYDINETASSLPAFWLEKMGLTEKDQLIIWEEVSMKTQSELSPSYSLKKHKLGSGDIVVFQKRNFDLNLAKFPKLSDFFNYLNQTTVVKFRSAEKCFPDIELKLVTTMKYKEVASKVAEELKLSDPYKLRFKSVIMREKKPRGPDHNACIRAREEFTLHDMLQVRDIYFSATLRSSELYVDILDVDVRKIENLEEYVLYIRDDHCKRIGSNISLFLNDHSTPIAICKELQERKLINLGDEYRMLQLYQDHQIMQVFSPDQNISNSRNNLYIVEKINKTEEEENKKFGGQLLKCVFFKHSQSGSYFEFYGEPFLFYFRKGEKFTDTKVRLYTKLGLTKRDFVGAQFAKVRKGEAVKFDDTDIVEETSFASSFHQYYFGIYLKDKSNQLNITSQ